MKKLLAALLGLLMLTGVFLACNPPEESSSDSTDSSSKSTEALTDENGNILYKADVPVVNYNGADFIVLTRSSDSLWAEPAIFAEADDTTVLGASTWKRNEQVMGEYNIEFVFQGINTSISGGTFYSLMLENSLSQDYLCDIANLGLIDAMNLLPTGILLNLQEVPYINLEQPWWAQKSNASIALLNRQYFAINDMLLNDKLDSYALFFNKTLFDNNNLEYPYELVQSGDWTIDEFKRLITDFGYDVNNNSIKDMDDQYGMIYQRMDAFFAGFSITGATLNEEGIPEMTDFSELIQDAYDIMYSLRNTYSWNEWGYWDDGHLDDDTQHYISLSARSLFACVPLGAYTDWVPQVEDNIGVVPCPKLTETQEDYITRAGSSGTTVITIPSTCQDRERAGIIVEALGAVAKNITSPAFYETLLTDRYAQDEESKEMISIIIETEIIDVDYMAQWGYIIRELENNIKNKNNAVASTYAKLISKANAKMEEYIEQIENIE